MEVRAPVGSLVMTDRRPPQAVQRTGLRLGRARLQPAGKLGWVGAL